LSNQIENLELAPRLVGVLGERIYLFDSVSSTNSFLAEADKPSLCLARRQTAGRGREGKRWETLPGNIALSLSWPFANHQHMQSLSLVAGLALVDFLADLGLQPGLKWPNDLLLNECKLAGILVESHQIPTGVMAVIGVGVNLLNHPRQQPGELPATHLAEVMEGSQLPTRLALSASLANHLFARITHLQTHGFASLRDRWMTHACWLHKRVHLGDESGVYQGIDDQGRLLMQTRQGLRVRPFVSGSLRLVSEEDRDTNA